MAERKIIIGKARVEDLDEMARLYSDFMFESFFLKFGSSFVRLYLDGMIRSRNCCALVAGKTVIAGFIVAALDSGKMLRELLSKKNVARALLSQCLKHPGTALQGLESFLYPLHTRLKKVSAELLFIAVDPAFRRRGLARELIQSMLDTLKEKGVRRVKVSTLIRNGPVNALLEKSGFRKRRTFRIFNKDMAVYDFEIK